MEIVVLEQEDKRIKFQLKGAGHTFCNHLKRELYHDDAVDVAAYTIEHPLVGIPTFIVQLKKKASFKKILSDAAKRIKKQNKDSLASFKKLK